MTTPSPTPLGTCDGEIHRHPRNGMPVEGRHTNKYHRCINWTPEPSPTPPDSQAAASEPLTRAALAALEENE